MPLYVNVWLSSTLAIATFAKNMCYLPYTCTGDLYILLFARHRKWYRHLGYICTPCQVRALYKLGICHHLLFSCVLTHTVSNEGDVVARIFKSALLALLTLGFRLGLADV